MILQQPTNVINNTLVSFSFKVGINILGFYLKKTETAMGVTQGSFLGPVLFRVNVNRPKLKKVTQRGGLVQ